MPSQASWHISNPVTATVASRKLRCYNKVSQSTLRYRVLCCTGYSNIPLEAAKARGIPVCNAPGKPQTADQKYYWVALCPKCGILHFAAICWQASSWLSAWPPSSLPSSVDDCVCLHQDILTQHCLKDERATASLKICCFHVENVQGSCMK